MHTPTHWQSPSIPQLQTHLAGFRDWVLCGGHSVDALLGRQTRAHGDIDIGVLRSRLTACLNAIGHERVFLCDPPGQHRAWDGGEVPARVHDIWISDAAREHWVMQILVFDDEGDEVYYRRDPRIRWPQRSHAVAGADGIALLNPLITFLYKANRQALEDKDAQDLGNLIAALPDLLRR